MPRERITVRKMYDEFDYIHQSIEKLGERFESALNSEVEIELPKAKIDWVSFGLGVASGIVLWGLVSLGRIFF